MAKETLLSSVASEKNKEIIKSLEERMGKISAPVATTTSATPETAPQNIQSQTQSQVQVSNPPEMSHEEETTSEPKIIVEPVSQITESSPTPIQDIARFRTYKSDLQEAISSQNISASKIVMKEKSRQRKMAAEQAITGEKKRAPIYLLLAIILVLLGVGAIFLVFSINHRSETPTSLFGNDSGGPVIGVDRVETVTVDLFAFSNTTKKLQEASLQTLPRQVIRQFSLVRPAAAGATAEPVTSSQLLQDLLKTRAPASLIRSLEEDFMYGIYGGQENDPFLIFKIKSYNEVFAGLSSWERVMADDLLPLFKNALEANEVVVNNPDQTEEAPEETTEEDTGDVNNATETTENGDADTTDTADTTENTPSEPKIRLVRDFDPTNFVDLVIADKDSRAIVKENREVVFFYTIVDRQFVVMTTSAEALFEILDRSRVRELSK